MNYRDWADGFAFVAIVAVLVAVCVIGLLFIHIIKHVTLL
jgi:hypothetical protein